MQASEFVLTQNLMLLCMPIIQFVATFIRKGVVHWPFTEAQALGVHA